MRTILLATLVAAGIGFLGASGASATPANGISIRDAIQAADVTQVGWHGPRRSHWRWGSRRYWRWHWR